MTDGTLVSDDWVSRFEDAGFDALVSSIAPSGYSGNVLLTHLNDGSNVSYCTMDMLAKYLADRHEAGALSSVELMDGPPASGAERYDAPTGLGSGGGGVWFTEPDAGTETVRWYVNGQKKIERDQDLSTNRSATLAELGAESGDYVQVCIIISGVVGWWARIQV